MNNQELIGILKERFNQNFKYHPKVLWEEVLKRLTTKGLDSVKWMELTGGEPDIIIIDNTYYFVDTCVQSPSGRRSVCYDQKALEERKEHKPMDSALNMCEKHEVELLNFKDYLFLQSIFEFDTHTSSWVLTTSEVRQLGGALFAEFRYKKSFLLHNPAESYYGSRGFRVKLKI